MTVFRWQHDTYGDLDVAFLEACACGPEDQDDKSGGICPYCEGGPMTKEDGTCPECGRYVWHSETDSMGKPCPCRASWCVTSVAGSEVMFVNDRLARQGLMLRSYCNSPIAAMNVATEIMQVSESIQSLVLAEFFEVLDRNGCVYAAPQDGAINAAYEAATTPEEVAPLRAAADRVSRLTAHQEHARHDGAVEVIHRVALRAIAGRHTTDQSPVQDEAR